jgi:hypothetical protein
LRSLKLSNLQNAVNKEFVTVLLEENNPNLVINTDFDHLSEKTIEKVKSSFNKELTHLKEIENRNSNFEQIDKK